MQTWASLDSGSASAEMSPRADSHGGLLLYVVGTVTVITVVGMLMTKSQVLSFVGVFFKVTLYVLVVDEDSLVLSAALFYRFCCAVGRALLIDGNTGHIWYIEAVDKLFHE